MGCDIHIVLERRKKDQPKWIGLWTSNSMRALKLLVARRDYGFFTEVARVRGDSRTALYARNIPEDVSALAWAEYMNAPTDHHTASHLTTEEFCGAWFRANPNPENIRKEYAVYDLLGIDADYPANCEYRVVFWFDN